MRRCSVLIAVVTAACGSTQSFRDGVQALCDLPDHVPYDGRPAPEQLTTVAAWAEGAVTNSEAKQLGSAATLAANRDGFAAAVAKAGIAKCKLLDNEMELQSYADAMKVVCTGAMNPAFLQSHLFNTEVVKAMAKLGNWNPSERASRFRAMTERARLGSCPNWDTPAMTLATAVPRVADRGVEPLVDSATSVVITTTGIVVEGKPIVAVHGGEIDPAEKAGGADGIVIPRLQKFVQMFVDASVLNGKRPTAVNLNVDPAVSYALVFESMVSIAQGGIGAFALVVLLPDGKTVKAIPLALADNSWRKLPGLGVVVAIDKDRLAVWTTSGKEGTATKPALAVALDRIADVQTELAAILQRHPDLDRLADRRVTVIADPATRVQALADVLVAVRAGSDGTQLFSNVALAAAAE